MPENEWQLLSTENNSKWIEEEELLLDFAENSKLTKTPLENIALTFVYTDLDRFIVGVSKTTIQLEKKEKSSILHHSIFIDKMNTAKNLTSIFPEELDKHNWLQKSYEFEDAALYSIDDTHPNKTTFNKRILPISISKTTTQILASLTIFHDLYEIIILMREYGSSLDLLPDENLRLQVDTNSPQLSTSPKSILKDISKKNTKTKKVRFYMRNMSEYKGASRYSRYSETSQNPMLGLIERIISEDSPKEPTIINQHRGFMKNRTRKNIK
jgi:hypothetical protein